MTSSHARLVGPEWLRDRLSDPDLRIVDATVHLRFDESGAHTESGRETYRAAHLPGAIFLDQLSDVTAHDGEAPFAVVDSSVFAERVGAVGLGDEHTIVVYDHANGIWATRLWWQLRLEGHDDVVVLDGGLAAWRDAGLPVEAGDVVQPPAIFTASRRDGLIASTEAVVAAAQDPSVLLVNALDRDAFAAGRIPGSVNVPFAALVDDDGRMRPLDEVRPMFEEAGALDPAMSPVTYCGGGIAATAVAFSLLGLGRDDVAVYDGSLNAWRADPARPLERD